MDVMSALESRTAAGAPLYGGKQPTFDKPGQVPSGKAEQSEFRKAFDQFVGQAFYGSLLKEMRKSQQGVAYLDGGRAEEVFRGQLDQLMVERLNESSAAKLSQPMFELMQLSETPRPEESPLPQI